MKQPEIQYYKLRQTLDKTPTSDEIISLQGKYQTLSASIWIKEIVSTLELSVNDVYHCQGILAMNVQKCLEYFDIKTINTKNGKTTRINQKVKQFLIDTLGLKSGNKGYSFTLFKQKDPEIYKEYCCKEYNDMTYISGDKMKMTEYRKMYVTRNQIKTKLKNNATLEKRNRRKDIIEKYQQTHKGRFNSITFIDTLIEYYHPTEITLSRNLINMHYDDILKLNKKDYKKIIKNRIMETCDIDYPSHGIMKPNLASGMLSIQQVINMDIESEDELDISESE